MQFVYDQFLSWLEGDFAQATISGPRLSKVGEQLAEERDAPIEVPISDLSQFKIYVQVNPFPEDSGRPDPVLRILQDYLQYYDRYDNKVDAFDRAADRAEYNGLLDADGMYAQREWKYVTDDGEIETPSPYTVGFGNGYDDFFIPAKPGRLYMRYVNFSVNSSTHEMADGEWSEPLRITHGYNVHDRPFEPHVIFTDPYIPIERMV